MQLFYPWNGDSAGFPLRLYFERMRAEGFVEESSRHRVETQRQNCLMILVSLLRFFGAKLSYIISLSNDKLLVTDVILWKVNNSVEWSHP